MILSEKILTQCEKILGYRFKDRDLLQTALTHSSGANTHVESNERLEFLGDSILGFVIAHYLYALLPLYSEGKLSQLKSAIVSRKTCCRLSKRLELDSFLIVGKGVTSVQDSMISNVMESIIGAIFLDGGYEEARRFIVEKFQQEINAYILDEKGENDDEHLGIVRTIPDDELNELCENYKARLQTIVQRRSPELLPVYIIINERGPAHSKRFQIAAKIGDRQYASAWGKTKKEAEQRAALNALHEIQGLTPPDIDETNSEQ